MPATQRNRPVQITTPLGEDVLLFYRMNGNEQLSGLFEYEVELLSEKPDINPENLLGKNVTISLALPNDQHRYFNAYVTRFGHYDYRDDYAIYRATLRPWLWFLSRAANCRIFQNKSTPEIIKQVLADQGFSGELKDSLSGSYQPRTYCVQYRETDFNFISRLMEEEGIYYYFAHSKNKHQLVLMDKLADQAFPDYAVIPFHYEASHVDRTRADHVERWGFAKEVQTGSVAMTDYDFEKPKADLRAISSKPENHSHAGYEVFDYTGVYNDIGAGETLTRLRREEQHTRYQRFEGSANARGLSVGYKFKLTDHPRADQNTEYLIVSARFSLANDDYLARGHTQVERAFDCAFTAIGNQVIYRPPRATPKPMIYGIQTAMVTGPAGDEIYTDKYGRVKVQFHWDRFGNKDQESSCWIRVAHPWAGKNWGMVAIPRIGHEVVVEFLEGDPDQPLIVGSVYNADMMPPYDLPGNATQAGIKSRSSKAGGTSNFNELRFEDKKGSEQIFLHAEKNQDIEVENNETHWVGHDRSKTIDHDETTHVKHDRTETVDNNETITIGSNRSESVGSNETISIGSNRTETVGSNEAITVGLSRTRAVGVNEAIAIGAAQEIVVGAVRSVTVGANQTTNIGNSHSISVGSDQSSTIGDNRSASIANNDSLTVGKNITINAGDSITITTGKASISMKKDGTITITGKDITIKGSGAINAKADKDVVIKGKNVLQN